MPNQAEKIDEILHLRIIYNFLISLTQEPAF